MNKLVLIGGPDENVTQPWQSALYTFTDKNYSLVPFKESELYTQDQFGLKTLDDQGKIHSAILVVFITPIGQKLKKCMKNA